MEQVVGGGAVEEVVGGGAVAKEVVGEEPWRK